MERRAVENHNGNRLLYYEFDAEEVAADGESDSEPNGESEAGD